LPREIKTGRLTFFDQLREPCVVEMAAEVTGLDMAVPEARHEENDRDARDARPMPPEKAPRGDDGAVVSEHDLDFYRSMEIPHSSKAQAAMRRIEPAFYKVFCRNS
jgi:hypothetical protein